MIGSIKKFHTSSVEETMKVAEEFAATLKDGDAIGLYGELGSGKTHFVKGIAKALGITEYVKSPSFTIVNIYEGATLSGGSSVRFSHIDLYRVEDASELDGLGLEEYICDTGVSVVEWAEKAGEFETELSSVVRFTVEGEFERRIDIERR